MHEILSKHSTEVAPQLLGWILERQLPGGIIRGRITETEAYHQDDPASHSFRGQTERNRSMFGAAGHAYVYFTYGMHFCMNIVTGPAGSGEGVLIRALEIIEGEELTLANRGGKLPLATGPGRLCQALKIDRSMDGHDLTQVTLKLLPGKLQDHEIIRNGPRIGIQQAKEMPYRFWLGK